MAREQAKAAEDEKRKAELEKIADVCSHVPEKPAGDFHEALQSLWFAHVVILQEVGCISAVSPGRLDKYLFPYYENDVKSERLLRDEALELVECAWIKFVENGAVQLLDNKAARYHAGFPISENVNIGGIDETGDDITNDSLLRLPPGNRRLGTYSAKSECKNKSKNP